MHFCLSKYFLPSLRAVSGAPWELESCELSTCAEMCPPLPGAWQRVSPHCLCPPASLSCLRAQLKMLEWIISNWETLVALPDQGQALLQGSWWKLFCTWAVTHTQPLSCRHTAMDAKFGFADPFSVSAGSPLTALFVSRVFAPFRPVLLGICCHSVSASDKLLSGLLGWSQEYPIISHVRWWEGQIILLSSCRDISEPCSDATLPLTLPAEKHPHFSLWAQQEKPNHRF